MKHTNRIKFLSIILVLAYLLSACSGTAPQSGAPAGGGKVEPREVAFTGSVDSVSAGSITVSGQVVTIDANTVMDSNIQVGDIVKVEALVSESGAVTALKIESSGGDDTANTNDGNANDDNTNDDANANDDNSNDVNGNDDNSNDDNSNDNGGDTAGTEQEVSGVVDAISAESVTVDGVTYQFASFTEIKEVILVGDQVKLHVIVGADGSLTVREIEKIAGTEIGDDNSNDDNGNDDNGNDDDSNDDNGNDDNSNGGSNDNG